MSLESRLKKIEEVVDRETKVYGPGILWLYSDDNQEEILKQLKAKYGEDYNPCLIISVSTREEGRNNKMALTYKEIEDL